MIRGILMALSFLTVLPIPLKGGPQGVARTTPFFPLAGLLKGLILIGLASVVSPFVPVKVLAGGILLLHTGLSGGLHLDGLADTIDAVAARTDRQRRLRIMKDPSVGPLGATALFLVLLLKFLCIEELLSEGLWAELLLFPVAGTTAMAGACYFGSPARTEGLGSLFIRETGTREVLTALLLATFSVIAIGLLFSRTTRVMIVMITTVGIALVLTRCLQRMFHGLTGDNIGAVGESSELVFLVLSLVRF